jgi:hypothetical protein
MADADGPGYGPRGEGWQQQSLFDRPDRVGIGRWLPSWDGVNAFAKGFFLPIEHGVSSLMKDRSRRGSSPSCGDDGGGGADDNIVVGTPMRTRSLALGTRSSIRPRDRVWIGVVNRRKSPLKGPVRTI